MIALQTGLGGLSIDARTVLAAAGVLLGAYVVSRAIAAVVIAISERSQKHRISIKMLLPVAKFLVYGIAVYLVVGPLLRLSATQVLAISGLLAAALGFGLKDLFAGVIGGLVIIVERPYQVGDKVSLGEHYGEVTDVGLRATTLTTPDDTQVMVPNDSLFNTNVANANDGAPEMQVVVDVRVAPGADLEVAREIMRDALATSPYVYVDDDHPIAVRIQDETYYRTVRGKAYVADLREEFAFSTDVTQRTLTAYQRQGVPTPEVPPAALEN